MDLQAALNQSETGSRLFMEQRASLAALNDEFNVLQTELIAEEQALRDARMTTDPEEFKILAEAFDLKSTKARKLYTDRREALAHLSARNGSIGFGVFQCCGANYGATRSVCRFAQKSDRCLINFSRYYG